MPTQKVEGHGPVPSATAPQHPPRRRLLAGSVAAPLVMTVTAASGQSRTTFSACLDNAGLRPKPKRVMAAGLLEPDEWLRVRLSVYSVGFPDLDGKIVAEPGKYFIGPNKVSMFRLDDARSEIRPATLVTKFDASTPRLSKVEIEKRFALAYADKNGKIVGYAWERNGGTHCKKSCFSSVMARAKA